MKKWFGVEVDSFFVDCWYKATYYVTMFLGPIILDVEVGHLDGLELGIEAQCRYGCHGVWLHLGYMDIGIRLREWYDRPCRNDDNDTDAAGSVV